MRPVAQALPASLWYLPFVVGCAAIFAVSSMQRPPVPEPLLFWQSDKLMHATAYGVLGVLALLGAQRRRGLVRAAVLEAWLLASAYGATDEFHQSFVPGRSVSVLDWLADTVGSGLAVVVVARVARQRRTGE